VCKAVGKKFNDYSRLANTQEFLAELSSVTGIPATDLVTSFQGGNPALQGTWVHPDVAMNLGQWCSPKFAVAVARWVREWLSGNVKQAKMPYHLERYLANRAAVPPTHWSMLNEMTFLLIAPLEQDGYRLPDNMLPDISTGRMFCDWLRDNGFDPDEMPRYKHVYADGRVVEPRLYPNALLHKFRENFHGVWMQEKCVNYFQKRDPKALEHIPALIDYSKQAVALTAGATQSAIDI